MKQSETLNAGSLHAACSAAFSEPTKTDHSECAPYWLCRSMAQYLVEVGEPCERVMSGGDTCVNSSDCITEWCAPCAAKAWLDEQKRLEAPMPQNEKLSV